MPLRQPAAPVRSSHYLILLSFLPPTLFARRYEPSSFSPSSIFAAQHLNRLGALQGLREYSDVSVHSLMGLEPSEQAPSHRALAGRANYRSCTLSSICSARGAHTEPMRRHVASHPLRPSGHLAKNRDPGSLPAKLDIGRARCDALAQHVCINRKR